jgi:hypothetical protein
MKRLIFLCAFNIAICSLFAQTPSLTKKWDVRFGGFLADGMWSCIQTTDGGYIMGGGVYSGIGGDKTQDNWDTTYNTYDFWVVKTDSLGNKEWDKRFGGFSDDGIETSSLYQTGDAGYVLAGLSSSGVGGDKTQPSWGGWDYWMVKIDAQGNKLWDKRFGGTADDLLFAAAMTTDGGNILCGTSYSDISGDKTQNNWGGTDYWVVKTDSAGNKLWDKRFGGYSDDFLYAMQATSDGGYILGGISMSDTGGDKTQPNWDIGWYNYWVVKIDSLGNKLWDHVYGGTQEDDLRAILETPDKGFLFGGYSLSDSGGDKTQNSFGSYDYWIVKTDSLGNKQWDKDYGGAGEDELYSLALTNDGGYLLAGDSWSDSGGDKTENNTAPVLSWIVKIDSLGNKQWDKTIFVNEPAGTANAFQTSDGCYLIASTTYAGVGYYKSQPSWNSSGDYWIVKFCDTVITGLDNVTADIKFAAYPNPFTSDLNIAIQKQALSHAVFTICNARGQTVYNQNETNLSDNYTKMLDLSYLAAGVYFVEVVVDGEVVTREVVKE